MTNKSSSTPQSELSAHGELLLYATDDGEARFFLRAEHGTVWLTQLELASLFQTSKQNVSLHIKNIFSDGELREAATVKDYLTVQNEGTRQVKRPVQLYNLDLILAVGYRVRSPRGVQFRQWATTHLKEYLIKGFVIDDVRLKQPEAWDYFDELLERIRDIRASEKRFYQKIRDLFSLSVDYRDDIDASAQFFAEVQNKILFAITEKTAAELIVERADASQPNMALQTWKGNRVRKGDVTIAKNYLITEEIEELNRIAVMFLDYAEDRAKRRQNLNMADWRQYMDNFLAFNERPLLKGSGAVSHEQMTRLAHDRYEEFDVKRRKIDAIRADADDIAELERIDRSDKGKKLR